MDHAGYREHDRTGVPRCLGTPCQSWALLLAGEWGSADNVDLDWLTHDCSLRVAAEEVR